MKSIDVPGNEYYVDENGTIRRKDKKNEAMGLKEEKKQKPVSKSVVVRPGTISAGGGAKKIGG